MKTILKVYARRDNVKHISLLILKIKLVLIKKNLEWNSKAEPSAICQYVCLSFLFVQPISS